MAKTQTLSNTEVAARLGVSVTQVNVIRKRNNITAWNEQNFTRIKDGLEANAEENTPKLQALASSPSNPNGSESVNNSVEEPGELENIDESQLNTVETGASEVSLGGQYANQSQEIRIDNQGLDEAQLEREVAQAFIQGQATELAKQMAYEQGANSVKRELTTKRIDGIGESIKNLTSTDLQSYISGVVGKSSEFSEGIPRKRTQNIRNQNQTYMNSLGI